MDCHIAEPMLSAYLDGELPEGQRRSLSAHLSECPACARQVAALRQISALYRDLPEPPLPEGLKDRLLAVMRQEMAERPATPSRPWRFRLPSLVFGPWPALAGAATVVLGVSLMVYQGHFRADLTDLKSILSARDKEMAAQEGARVLDAKEEEPLVTDGMTTQYFSDSDADTEQGPPLANDLVRDAPLNGNADWGEDLLRSEAGPTMAPTDRSRIPQDMAFDPALQDGRARQDVSHRRLERSGPDQQTWAAAQSEIAIADEEMESAPERQAPALGSHMTAEGEAPAQGPPPPPMRSAETSGSDMAAPPPAAGPMMMARRSGAADGGGGGGGGVDGVGGIGGYGVSGGGVGGYGASGPDMAGAPAMNAPIDRPESRVRAVGLSDTLVRQAQEPSTESLLTARPGSTAAPAAPARQPLFDGTMERFGAPPQGGALRGDAAGTFAMEAETSAGETFDYHSEDMVRQRRADALPPRAPSTATVDSLHMGLALAGNGSARSAMDRSTLGEYQTEGLSPSDASAGASRPIVVTLGAPIPIRQTLALGEPLQLVTLESILFAADSDGAITMTVSVSAPHDAPLEATVKIADAAAGDDASSPTPRHLALQERRIFRGLAVDEPASATGVGRLTRRQFAGSVSENTLAEGMSVRLNIALRPHP